MEVENFYLTSNFPDYFAEGIIERKDGNFYINGNNKIEREFNYQNFVIEICKNIWDNIDITDEFICYIASDNNLYGIKDDITNGQSEFIKIICNDNYIQTYISQDKKIWDNIGGIQLKENELINKQGFQKNSNKQATIKDYKIYTNPYVTIQNLSQNYKVELYDTNNTLMKSRLFEENMQCQIFLDYCMNGYLKFYDDNNNLIYTSDTLSLQYGDIYTFTNYELELYYMNNDITSDIKTTLNQDQNLNIQIEQVILKNISNIDNYNNLQISIETKFDDIVQLSLDGGNFNNTIIIDTLNNQSEVSIYIRISKSATNNNFNYRNFQLFINKVGETSNE